MAYPKLTPIIATGATTPRYVADRFADSLTPMDFGAKGDGSTNDTAAFSALEASASGRMVDLCGKSYAVEAVPAGNYYYNGRFVSGGRTVQAYDHVLAYWMPDEMTPTGIGNADVNFFISDGVTTPEDVETARNRAVPFLKDAILIGNRAGYGATKNRTYLSSCIAIGSGVMSYGTMTGAAEHNIGIGQFALHRVTSGDRNIGLGPLALVGLTSGRCNVAIGRDCAQGVTTGSYNVAMGYSAMGAYGWENLGDDIDGQTKITGSYNVAIGPYAAYHLSGESAENVVIGYNASLNTKIGSKTVCIGRGALLSLQKGTSINGKTIIEETLTGTYVQSGTVVTITMTGHHAVEGCYVVINFTSGDISGNHVVYVTSVNGNSFTLSSMKSMSTEGDCTATIFEQANESAQKAVDNVVIGQTAGAYLYSCNGTVAIGENALRGYSASFESEVAYSIALGHRALEKAKTATRATALGYLAGANAETVTYSVIAGDQATLNTNGTITMSVVIGSNAGMKQPSHSGNTLVGAQAGNITGSMTNCTCIGYSAMQANDSGTYSNSTAIGYGSAFTGNNQVQLGNTSTTTYTYGAVQDRSDARDKTDVRDSILGLDFILSLRPVDFHWDYRDDYVDYVEKEVEVVDDEGVTRTETAIEAVPVEKDGSRKRTRYHHGLIAQEVKSVLDAKGIDFGGYQDHSINGGKDVLTLGYEEFIAPIIKAIQEIDSRLKALEV